MVKSEYYLLWYIINVYIIDKRINKRKREAKYPDLDRCLYLWHSEQVRGHIPVSDEMLKTEAIEFS